MTIKELIERLSEIPDDWRCDGTRHGSIAIFSPDGMKFGFVFFDARANQIRQYRKYLPTHSGGLR